jgi:hypothetical protein
LQKISEELRVIEGYVINFSLRLGFTFDLPQKLGIVASHELAFGLIFTLQRITFDFTQTTQNPKISRLKSGNVRLVLSNAKPNRGLDAVINQLTFHFTMSSSRAELIRLVTLYKHQISLKNILYFTINFYMYYTFLLI